MVSHRMLEMYRRFSIGALCLFLMCGASWSQQATTSQQASLGEVTRHMDRFTNAVTAAHDQAQQGKVLALRGSLKGADEAWSLFYTRYRYWSEGGEAWAASMDAIQTSMMDATNALTPGRNLPLVAQTLSGVLEQLQSMREANNLPDIMASVKEVSTALEAMNGTLKSMNGKRISPGALSQLQQQWTETTAVWKSFTQTLIDINVFGFDEARLTRFKRMVAMQNRRFAAIGRALGNRNIQRMLTNISNAQGPLFELIRQLGLAGLGPQIGDPKRL